jgi:hypothetical protein
MRPAEFQTLMEGLHLTPREVSMLTLVPEATLKSWLLGNEDIPDGVAGLVRDIEREVESRLTRALEKAAGREEVTLVRFRNPVDFKRSGPDMVPIPAMLAYRCHGALVARLYAALRRTGVTVTVKFWQADAGSQG